MMGKANVLLKVGMGLLALTFLLGCVSTSSSPTQETKLTRFQGIGVLQFGPQVSEVTPESNVYVSLLLRNNAQGKAASNIIVSLDNIAPFKLVTDCAGEQDPEAVRTQQCTQYLDLDNPTKLVKPCSSSEYTAYAKAAAASGITAYQDGCTSSSCSCGLSWEEHGISQIFPNEELDFNWVLKAPTASEVGYLKYQHTLYYHVTYAYSVRAAYNIQAMSNAEQADRRKKGEDWQISGEFSVSNGELQLYAKTNQPILYSDRQGGSGQQYDLSYSIRNLGQGAPEGNLSVYVELPPGISPANGSFQKLSQLNWCFVNYDGNMCCDPYSGDSEKTCYVGNTDENKANSSEYDTEANWLNHIFDDVGTEASTSKPSCKPGDGCSIDNVSMMIKRVQQGKISSDEYVMHLPFVISNLKYLQDNQIPLVTYPFYVTADYNYTLEDKAFITVQPISTS